MTRSPRAATNREPRGDRGSLRPQKEENQDGEELPQFLPRREPGGPSSAAPSFPGDASLGPHTDSIGLIQKIHGEALLPALRPQRVDADAVVSTNVTRPSPSAEGVLAAVGSIRMACGTRRAGRRQRLTGSKLKARVFDLARESQRRALVTNRGNATRKGKSVR